LRKDLGDLNQNQIENLSKLTADALTLGILISIFALALDDDDRFKKGPGKMALNIMRNAMGDLNIATMMVNMSTSSPIIVASYITRLGSAMYNVVAYAATGEFHDMFKSGMKTTGFTKSIWAFAE